MKLGFTEKEVGHMSYYKWKKMYEHFKKMHDFETHKLIFKSNQENDTQVKNEEVIFF